VRVIEDSIIEWAGVCEILEIDRESSSLLSAS
jgi:hypothetical protein